MPIPATRQKMRSGFLRANSRSVMTRQLKLYCGQCGRMIHGSQCSKACNRMYLQRQQMIACKEAKQAYPQASKGPCVGTPMAVG